MSTPVETKPSETQQGAAASRRGTSRLLRATIMALLLAAACYLAHGAGKLLADWRRVSQPIDVRQAIAAEFAPQPMALPLAGHWSFAELDWKLRSNTVSEHDLTSRFNWLAESAARQSGDHLPDVSTEIMQLVERLQLKPVEREGVCIYRLNRPGMRAQLVVRDVAGCSKAVSFAAGYPQQDEQWQLFELSPLEAAANATTTQPFLLPLPPGAARVGGRFADDGSALLELVTLNTTAEQLFETWKSAGWKVRSIRSAGADEFRYLCAHRNEEIYAWSADEPRAIQNLMLVRTPNSADTDR